MSNDVDILENEIREKYPKVLDILLRDHTTRKNIFWATDNYLILKDFNEGMGPYTIFNIYSITMQSDFIKNERIDISYLPVGLYFIQIGNYTEKFIVVR